MTLKKYFYLCTLFLSIFLLASCAGNKQGPGSMNGAGPGVTDANLPEGVQTSGVDTGSGFGSDELSSSGRITNGRVYYFDFDRSDIHESDKPAILSHVNYLMKHPQARIILEGHTDPKGSREYNVALGERRANAVAEFMKEKGVNSAQIRVVSYGAERLAVPGRSEQDYQLDRRVVLVFQRK